MSDAREGKIEDLIEVLDENTKSKALFAAGDYLIRMRGGTTAVPTGRIAELMQLAVEQGSVTPHEIAEALNTSVIRIEYSSAWAIHCQ